MTSIPLYHLVWYLTSIEGITWRDQDYQARAIVKIAKGEPFKGSLRVKVGGQDKVFTEGNGHEFLQPLCNKVGKYLSEAIEGEFALVPVPNSSATTNNAEPFRTMNLATKVARAVGRRAKVVPALRWARQKARAHNENGLRDIRTHYDLLRVLEKPNLPIVLFDDVKTSGSQLIAAYRKLRDAGLAPKAACVVGHASREQETPMLGWSKSQLVVEEDDPFDF